MSIQSRGENAVEEKLTQLIVDQGLRQDSPQDLQCLRGEGVPPLPNETLKMRAGVRRLLQCSRDSGDSPPPTPPWRPACGGAVARRWRLTRRMRTASRRRRWCMCPTLRRLPPPLSRTNCAPPCSAAPRPGASRTCISSDARWVRAAPLRRPCWAPRGSQIWGCHALRVHKARRTRTQSLGTVTVWPRLAPCRMSASEAGG